VSDACRHGDQRGGGFSFVTTPDLPVEMGAVATLSADDGVLTAVRIESVERSKRELRIGLRSTDAITAQPRPAPAPPHVLQPRRSRAV
jgi:hypothetical protein